MLSGRAEAVFTDTAGWSDQRLRESLERLKHGKLGWPETTGSAREWWEAFERENGGRAALVFRLAEELASRDATITDFFMASVYADTDSISATLHYFDHMLARKRAGV